MRGLDRLFSNPSKSGRMGRSALAISLLIGGVVTLSAGSTSAAAPASRIDLRVLLLDDNTPWVDGIENQMQVEGVPYTAVPLYGSRPVINDAFLSSGDEAFFQAVVAPSATLDALTPEERTSLRAYEAKFGIREVDTYNWANPTLGLNIVDPVDTTGMTASVTAAGANNGFGYLNGPVPFSIGSYGYISEPLAAQVPGASYTTLVGAPTPSGATGSMIGVYSNAGVEQMVITVTLSQYLPHFKMLAHGIISWMTRGVHFGYNRNNFTMQVDDAFSAVALWNSDANCTPGEDCAPGSGLPELSTRMTPADVADAVAWEQANDYQFTLAFNGSYADSINDPLTQAFMANASAFRWLNHGSQHLYQGCIQNFTVAPWQCTFDAGGQIVYMSKDDIKTEIQSNIATGQALGLTFDPTEYLSGEHSGLFFNPQQPLDNPNFGTALTEAGINYIASDASRDPNSRAVGSAITIPRHPTALYYNTSTAAAAVDEYNWLYTSRTIGGSGYCDDNPATATCIAPLDPANGFTSYIVPTDAAYNMNFILSNDPRPFYSHVSNMSDEGLLYPMMETILGNYRAAFADSAPLMNLTLTQAATALDRQTKWAATGTSTATGYVQNGKVTITNPSGIAAPITVPTGSTVVGATLESYGGELSGWLVPGNTTGTLPGSVLTVSGSTAFVAGTVGTVNMTATGTPAASISLAGTLPAGLTFTPTPGAGVITGAPVAGIAGSYPLTITSISGTSIQVQPITLTVTEAPLAINVTGSTAFVIGQPGTVNLAATGFPTPTLTHTAGTLPAGVTFVASATPGTAVISGTPATTAAGSYPVTITATSGTVVKTQQVTIVVTQTPMVLTVPASAAFVIGKAGTVNMTATGNPTPTVTRTGTLPAGLTFTATPGGGVISGTPAAGTAGSYPLSITAVSGLLTQTKALTLVVSQAPAFTSAASANGGAGIAFTFNVTTTGSPAAVVTRTGTLPTGITFVAGANGTAKLSGTPTAAMAGRTFPLTFTATNSAGSVSQAFTLTIGRAPVFTGSQLALALSTRPYSYTVQTTGTPVATLTMTGTLPKGLTFVPATNGTAKLSGTPLRGTSGIYTLTFKATNVYGTTNRTFVLLVL
jgi:Putative Ig domain